MKKKTMLLAVLILTRVLVFADMYVEASAGYGWGKAVLNAQNMKDILGSGYEETVYGGSVKIGTGPVFGLSIYFVADISYTAHRFDNGSDFVQFNYLSAGAGFVVNLTRYVSLAYTYGYPFFLNETSVSGLELKSENDIGNYVMGISVSTSFRIREARIMVGWKSEIYNGRFTGGRKFRGEYETVTVRVSFRF